MYALITNQVLEKYPYSISDLKKDNPQTSFPDEVLESTLAEWNVFPVTSFEVPDYDATSQRVEESTPVLINGQWTQVWNVASLTSEEVLQMQNESAEQIRQQRQSAYQAEADPLFFKWQRKEATEQEWLDKVTEIKNRFPNPSN
jgi:hypothetical protein